MFMDMTLHNVLTLKNGHKNLFLNSKYMKYIKPFITNKAYKIAQYETWKDQMIIVIVQTWGIEFVTGGPNTLLWALEHPQRRGDTSHFSVPIFK